METPPDRQPHVFSTIETVVRIVVLALLLGWCFLILKPFISPVVWGIIIAVAVYPLYRRLKASLGNRPKLAAAMMAG